MFLVSDDKALKACELARAKKDMAKPDAFDDENTAWGHMLVPRTHNEQHEEEVCMFAKRRSKKIVTVTSDCDNLRACFVIYLRMQLCWMTRH